MKAFHLALFLLLVPANSARQFQLCELYYKLRHLGLDGYLGYEAKQLVCLSWYPAEANTQYYAVDHRDVPYYGIFQLSGLEWCNNGRHASQNKCNITCDKFLDDNIKDDIHCLKKALTEHKIARWRHYKENCTFAVLRLYHLTCAHFFENDSWYKELAYGKKTKKPLSIHVHFPKD